MHNWLHKRIFLGYIRGVKLVAGTVASLILSLLVTGCGDDTAERKARAEQFTTSTKPAPNPRRESLESLVRKDISAPTGLPGAPKFELYSEYSGEDIRQVTGVSGRSLMLCFTAPWCEYSAKMRRSLQDLARMEKGNVQVVEVNADAYPVLAEQFSVTRVPTTFLYVEGVRLRSIEGAYNAPSIQAYIRNVLSRGDK